MKFFKPEDFHNPAFVPVNRKESDNYGLTLTVSRAVGLANAKLEKEGHTVYVNDYGQNTEDGLWTFNKRVADTHKALLINIEPIEKEKSTYEELEKELFILKAERGMEKARKQLIADLNKSCCEHPNEKVKLKHREALGAGGTNPLSIIATWTDYYCECGVKVTPTGYEEVK